MGHEIKQEEQEEFLKLKKYLIENIKIEHIKVDSSEDSSINIQLQNSHNNN